MAPITIKAIAKMLGVSKSTVSRALTRQSDVHAETRRKVLELAQKLNYQPNSIALNLRQKRTKTLGVIIPETMNSFFSRAVGGIQQVAAREGYNVIVCQSNESTFTEKNSLDSLISNHADGLLISISRETANDEHFHTLIEKHIPVVFFDRICERLDTAQVVSNNFEIAFQATQHLLDQGCRRIAILTGPLHLYISEKRLAGYKEALRNTNMHIDESLIFADFKADQIEAFVANVVKMKRKPDAIFALNDMTALEIMHGLKNAGVKIPHDIAVMGFNNERFGQFTEPSLSTIDLPAVEIGTAAAEMLFRQLKDPAQKGGKMLIKSKLVLRESTKRIT